MGLSPCLVFRLQAGQASGQPENTRCICYQKGGRTTLESDRSPLYHQHEFRTHFITAGFESSNFSPAKFHRSNMFEFQNKTPFMCRSLRWLPPEVCFTTTTSKSKQSSSNHTMTQAKAKERPGPASWWVVKKGRSPLFKMKKGLIFLHFTVSSFFLQNPRRLATNS